MMGVSGSGKTVTGRLWAERLECDFLEGDRRHPVDNILKMQSQIPLEDADREPWLQAIENNLQQAVKLKRETVITCSALKVAYRQRLTFLELVQLVWLDVPASELKQRLTPRSDHYMKIEMLESQLATFEPITPEEDVMTINGLNTPTAIVEELYSKAMTKFPSLKEPWWKRHNRLVAK
jgi:gluconokinase